jgi:hypothetical protein
MKLKDLTQEQKIELKQALLTQDRDVSYGELANADELVSDKQLEDAYGSTEFTEDDFFCTCQK